MKEISLFEDVVNRKALIRFKLLLNYYHNGEQARNADIVEKMCVAKSEVSACVTELMQCGYLENAGNRKKRLTDKGYILATEIHGKYELSLTLMREIFVDDEEKAIRNAEIMTITMTNEVCDYLTNQKSHGILVDTMKRFTKFKGKILCEKAEPGIYQVEISFMKILDSNYIRLKKQAKNTPEVNPEYKITDNDVYAFVEEFSMADMAFVTPAYLHFDHGNGYLHLHRRMMREKSHDGYELEGKALSVAVFDGKEFVECPFSGDDVKIPVKYFYFIRSCGEIIGKATMRFMSDVVNHMPPRVAKVIIKL